MDKRQLVLCRLWSVKDRSRLALRVDETSNSLLFWIEARGDFVISKGDDDDVGERIGKKFLSFIKEIQSKYFAFQTISR